VHVSAANLRVAGIAIWRTAYRCSREKRRELATGDSSQYRLTQPVSFEKCKCKTSNLPEMAGRIEEFTQVTEQGVTAKLTSLTVSWDHELPAAQETWDSGTSGLPLTISALHSNFQML
jgi:hypothetical protein